MLRRRVPIDAVRREFLRVVPRLEGHPDQRAELRVALDEMAAARAVRLPRLRRLYDAIELPPLPRWIEWPPPARHKSARDLARDFPWHPELAFIAGLPSLNHTELAIARRAQQFLVQERSTAQALTLRERSLLLFGDEKFLDPHVGGRIVGGSGLSLESLRCRHVHVPFVWRAVIGPDAPAWALVVENKDTFESAWQALSQIRTPIRFLIFGAGNAFQQSVRSLLDLPIVPARVLYFGDVDRRGLEIPISARKEAERAGLPLIEPAIGLYLRLFERDAQLQLTLRGAAADEETASALAQWLPQEMHAPAVRALIAGRRLPQEAVTQHDIASWLQDPKWTLPLNADGAS